MHIRKGLVYDKNTGELVGYCKLGDINNHLLKFEKECVEHTNSKELAKTVLDLMVQGLFNNLSFPYAAFPTSSSTGDQLIPIMYEAQMRVEKCDPEVLGFTIDGNSVNRSNYWSCYKELNYSKSPYRWDKDFRLKCLQDDFLPWLKKWEDEVKARNDVKGKAKKVDA
uniref:Transposable element P transposase-like RNase H domain-containing protein n=1 Tax=Amphimedon queenslandica TaxID=400682 RepID=A0A1X7VEV6_AMPQE